MSHLQYQPMLPSCSNPQNANAKSISQGSSSNNSDDDDSVDQVITHFMYLSSRKVKLKSTSQTFYISFLLIFFYLQELKLVHIEMYKMKLRERERRRRVAREHQVNIYYIWKIWLISNLIPRTYDIWILLMTRCINF